MENLQSELHKITVENCKLKASLKAATYEKEKLLELVKNVLTALDNSVAPTENIWRKPENYQTFGPANGSNRAEENSQYEPPSKVIGEQVTVNSKYER